MKKIRLIVSICALLFVVGCKREPMIHISEERQESIDAKQGNKKKKVEEKNKKEKTDKEKYLSMIDRQSLKNIDDSIYLDISDYLPQQANQLKHFTNGLDDFYTYIDFFNPGELMQVRYMTGNQMNIKVYYIDSTHITEMMNRENIKTPFKDFRNEAVQTPDSPLITSLQAPLKVGHQWVYDGKHSSEITAIYETFPLTAGEFKNVIEVKTSFDQYDLYQYFAQNDGIVAFYQEPKSEDQPKLFWELKENHKDVKMVQELSIWEPKVSDEGKDIEPINERIEFKTNDTLALVLDSIFKKNQWIEKDASVFQVYSDGQVATLELMQVNDTTFKDGIIKAMLQTVCDFLDVDQAKLFVNGTYFTNDTEFNEQGLYQSIHKSQEGNQGQSEGSE